MTTLQSPIELPTAHVAAAEARDIRQLPTIDVHPTRGWVLVNLSDLAVSRAPARAQKAELIAEAQTLLTAEEHARRRRVVFIIDLCRLRDYADHDLTFGPA